MIKFENVSLALDGKSVLDSISFSLPASGAFALTGPSGCGKTTLARIILGLERGFTGSVLLPDGLRIAAVFQEDRLLPWLSARQNVAAVLPDGVSPDEYLRLVELDTDADKLPCDLSGGMCRRVAIARALGYLVHSNAGLLLLDEPFTGLDKALRGRVIERISLLCRERLVLLITHDEAEIALMGAKKLGLFAARN